MRVGLAFNLRKDSLQVGAPDVPVEEFYSECDSMETIQAIRDALAEHHYVVLLEADETFYPTLSKCRPDIVFNFAEGLWGAARESQIPAMLEMLRIPYTGSDPCTMAICLVKFAPRRYWVPMVCEWHEECCSRTRGKRAWTYRFRQSLSLLQKGHPKGFAPPHSFATFQNFRRSASEFIELRWARL